MRVDVTPPHIQLVSLAPRVFSPDGDGRKERIIARYVIDEPAQALLYVDGIQRVRKRGQQEKGRIEWFGKVDGASLPPGVYRISLGSRDVAGNLGPRTRREEDPDPVRRARARPDRDRLPAAGSPCSCSATRPAWNGSSAQRTGTARPGTLKLRAPLQPGRYTLTVTANGFSDRAAVIVRSTEAMTTLAQIAGPVGCAGLALLLVATRRDLRIAGLAAWALGLGRPRALPRARRAPRPLLAAGAVAGLVVAVVGAWLLTRYPYLLAFATLACLPVRLPVTIGSEKAKPAAAALCGRGDARARHSRWQLAPAGYAHARARPGRVAACRRRRLDRALARLDARPEEGLDLPRRLHPPVRPAGDRLRPAAVARPLAHLALGRRSS